MRLSRFLRLRQGTLGPSRSVSQEDDTQVVVAVDCCICLDRLYRRRPHHPWPPSWVALYAISVSRERTRRECEIGVYRCACIKNMVKTFWHLGTDGA